MLEIISIFLPSALARVILPQEAGPHCPLVGAGAKAPGFALQETGHNGADVLGVPPVLERSGPR